MPFNLERVLIGITLVSVLRMAGLQAQELKNVASGDSDGDKNAATLFRAEVLPQIDLLPTMTRAEKDRLHDLLTRSRNLSLLFTVRFAISNTRLAPSEAGTIKQQFLSQQVQTWLMDSNVVLLVLGFSDRPVPKSRDFDIAGSRAQSVRNFLREQGGVRQPIYSLSMKDIEEHTIRPGVAEVWAVRP